jgi:hypothetical protein
MVVPGLVTVLLSVFVLLDLLRGFVALVLPGRWFLWIHGRVGNDGTGLLVRTGGIWLGMALVQGIALYFWTVFPFVLAIVAGLRFCEILADWTHLLGSRTLTTPGWITLSLLPPINLLAGIYFVLAPFTIIGP